jgi:formylglycine-generating enzyme required for sulfatase activity/uncharacterized protein
MKKNFLMILFISSGVLLHAKNIHYQDIELKSEGMIYFDSTKAKIITFGGYNTPKCKLAIGIGNGMFYLKKMNSTCWKGTNSKGIKIICNSDKSICKTRSELLAFAQSNSGHNSPSDKPSWCKSRNLNATERTICANQALGKLDFDLIKAYGMAKAKKQDLKQLAWLKKRNSCKSDIGCIQNAYEKRIRQLQEVVSQEQTSMTKTQALALVKKDYENLKSLPQKYKKDKEIVLAAVKSNEFLGDGAFKYADDSLKKDKKFVLVVVNTNGSTLEYVDNSLKKDKEVVLAAVRKFGLALEYADDLLKKDKEVVLAALKKGGHALFVADDSLKKDKTFILTAVKQNSSVFAYVDKSFKKDKGIVLEAVKKDGSSLAYADDSLKKDKEVVLAAVRKFGLALEYADDLLKKDKEVVLAAVKQNSSALKHADKLLKKDKGIVLEAVKKDGSSLAYADDSLKKDKEVVLAAVKQNSSALKHADKSLKKDKGIVLEAVKKDGSSLAYADDSLKKDKEVVLAAAKQNSSALVYADDSVIKVFSDNPLKKEKETILASAKQNGHTLKHRSGFTNSIGMKFVEIPSGSFMMGDRKMNGCPDEDHISSSEEALMCSADKHALPYHKVKIKGFYMAATEVTQAQYYKVMGKNPSTFDGKNNPVENVSWEDAQEFVKKLNILEHTDKYYLPTEEEWEYAVRAGSNTKFHFADDQKFDRYDGSLDLYGWYDKNSKGKTHPAALKEPNKWGLYDMLGNVFEWTNSCYTDNYSTTNCLEQNNKKIMVIRGGSWYHGYSSFVSSKREGMFFDMRDKRMGFRVACLKK